MIVINIRRGMVYPRANTLGIIIKDGKILLEEQKGKHSKGTGLYYRPIGGTIELGEQSNETIIREFKEEIGVDIKIKCYISCLENIFKIDENLGHEITQIYWLEFKDPNLYQKESIKIIEGSKVTNARWISLKDIYEGKKVLYPSGLSDLLLKRFK